MLAVPVLGLLRLPVMSIILVHWGHLLAILVVELLT
jgi:hypothetical protein